MWLKRFQRIIWWTIFLPIALPINLILAIFVKLGEYAEKGIDSLRYFTKWKNHYNTRCPVCLWYLDSIWKPFPRDHSKYEEPEDQDYLYEKIDIRPMN